MSEETALVPVSDGSDHEREDSGEPRGYFDRQQATPHAVAIEHPEAGARVLHYADAKGVNHTLRLPVGHVVLASFEAELAKWWADLAGAAAHYESTLRTHKAEMAAGRA